MSVYFYRRASDGLIKIGCTVDLPFRVRCLNNKFPGELLAEVPGYRVRELLFHHEFRDLRVTGEWFSPAYRLAVVIAEAAERGDTSAVEPEPADISGEDIAALIAHLGLTMGEAAKRFCRSASFFSGLGWGSASNANKAAYVVLKRGLQPSSATP